MYSAMTTDSRRPWKKNLYENVDYEDNYTDPSFLQDLQTNINVKFYTLPEAIQGATKLTNQMSCITGFLIVFYLLFYEKASPTDILLPSGLATCLGYVLCHGRQLKFTDLIEDSKTLLAVLIFGYIFSPLLHKLTDAISTDTICTMTVFVFILNLVFHDYGLDVAMVSKTISLNAEIFGSICLASRLSSSYSAFVLLVQSAIFFVLYPIFTARYWRPWYMGPIFIICCSFLYGISTEGFYIYIVIIVFINFVCPLIFVYQQKYKRNIHGPWDEAIVDEASSIDKEL
ncbi:phosphatidylinositol N-acetylglucosaminyltransferase subunit C [Episyrphus balteatus]|uniref:phosphatidylinositol N-acetylglucosaminyltransferase subunit C n=1 Tax=Episyrphus balteatus TaxID=286459 RepID=UPI0024864145|nr:phosphatidylinositol N-acetylglucosaminyltransferase subunit C [Episyrphus balteatus]